MVLGDGRNIFRSLSCVSYKNNVPIWYVPQLITSNLTDTTFMIVGAGLLFICIYQKRQPTITSGAFQVYGYFAGIMVLNLLSLLPIPDKAYDNRFPFTHYANSFWVLVFALLTYVTLVTSVHLYYAENLVFRRPHLHQLVKKLFSSGYPKEPVRSGNQFGIIFLAVSLWIYHASNCCKLCLHYLLCCK